MRTLRATLLGAALLAPHPLAPSARAWDSAGHRTITALAIHAMPGPAPQWLTARATLIADQSVVPDRWRAVRAPALAHASSPDHYIDLEELAPLGLRLDQLPPLRYEFIRAVALARVEHPSRPASPGADPAKIADWPGFLPWAICETHARVAGGMKSVRILERLRDRAQDANDTAALSLREAQLEMARDDVATHMGLLAHFVGDAAQPLHTTIHHHGWAGDNPKGYTTDRGIHSYIDGAIVTHHHVDFDALSGPVADTAIVPPADPLNPWPETLAYIQSSFARVEPLYALKLSGDLEREPGRALISSCMTDAARFLANLYSAAWRAAEPTDDDLRAFLRYDKIDQAQLGPRAP